MVEEAAGDCSAHRGTPTPSAKAPRPGTTRPGRVLRCARRSPALPAGAIPAPARAKPAHREPSLGRREVTTGVQRRQGDPRAVTHVKPDEPRDQRPEADTLEPGEGQEKAADNGEGGRKCRRGLRARHAWRGKRQRHLGEPSRSGWGPSRPPERTSQRNADAAGDVGARGRTPSAGKRRAGGSQGAGQESVVRKPLRHPEVGPRGPHHSGRAPQQRRRSRRSAARLWRTSGRPSGDETRGGSSTARAPAGSRGKRSRRATPTARRAAKRCGNGSEPGSTKHRQGGGSRAPKATAQGGPSASRPGRSGGGHAPLPGC